MEQHNYSRARIWCRDCGEEMYPLYTDILVFYCNHCKLRAAVAYEKTPEVELK